MPSYQDDLDAVLIAALTDALRKYFMEVLTIWFVDDAGQPGRTQEGLFKAITAYKNALTLRKQTFDGELVRRVLREALDQALHDYIMKLFGVWMHEGGKIPPPPTIARKRDHSLRSYLNARKALDELIL